MKLKEQLKLQKDIDVPWHVWTKFGQGAKTISVSGNQANLTANADYANIGELRRAVEFYVDQLGGKVKWEKL